MHVHSFFKDKDGKVVIGQTPNTPMLLFIVFSLVQLAPHTHVTRIAIWGARIAISYWAYLEIVSGVNAFRKSLGLVVLLYTIYTVVKVYL